MQGRVFIIAGSDSGGGAGIQADIKTVTALGGYAATAITALTAQNTLGVSGIHVVPTDFVAQQMTTVLEDIGADCIKIGMLGSAAVTNTVADVLEKWPDCPVVLDPVMVATSGDMLLDESGVTALRHRLLPRATVITPNLPEATALCGMEIADENAMLTAAKKLAAESTGAVLLKGGHGTRDDIADLLYTAGKAFWLRAPRIATRHTHGTGCTLAAAVATGIAQNLPLESAVRRARDYVQEAIREAPGFGRGHGPLNHAHGRHNMAANK